MKCIVHKDKSAGPSVIAFCKPTIQVGHFLLHSSDLARHFPGKNYLSVLVGEVALVQYFGISLVQEYKARDIPIFRERLSDVVNLASGVLLVGIWQKKSAPREDCVGGEVDDLAAGALPDGVKLCLDEYLRPLPDSPAYELGSTVRSDVLWDDGEAFLQWLSRNWSALHERGRAIRGHPLAEVLDVRARGVRDSVHMTLNVTAQAGKHARHEAQNQQTERRMDSTSWRSVWLKSLVGGPDRGLANCTLTKCISQNLRDILAAAD